MKPATQNCSHGPIAMLVTFLLFASSAFASHPVEQVIYSFQNDPDGAFPAAGLISDSAGNLYGTTQRGGGSGLGVVFELSPPTVQGGAWTETIIHRFQGSPTDGGGPGCNLIFDKAGNLYGTTSGGGLNNQGTVFELNPPATPGGAWTETLLFFFPADGSMGTGPQAGLVFDGIGNLYGTANVGGSSNLGTVFQLKPPATPGGTWTARVLHHFAGSPDGANPVSGVIFRKGALYGTTVNGGPGQQQGTVYRVSLANGTWTEGVLHGFRPGEGSNPYGGVIADDSGNLYGTIYFGPSPAAGTIFELSPPPLPGGIWQKTTLHSFSGGPDGSGPYTLTRDKLGNLYGTTVGGDLNGHGTAFKLKAPAVAGGSWTKILLHFFPTVSSTDGMDPAGKPILSKGTFYGTTYTGGSHGGGTVYTINIVP